MVTTGLLRPSPCSHWGSLGDLLPGLLQARGREGPWATQVLFWGAFPCGDADPVDFVILKQGCSRLLDGGLLLPEALGGGMAVRHRSRC